MQLLADVKLLTVAYATKCDPNQLIFSCRHRVKTSVRKDMSSGIRLDFCTLCIVRLGINKKHYNGISGLKGSLPTID